MLTDWFPSLHLNYGGGGGFPLFLAVTLIVLMVLLHLACGVGIGHDAGRYVAKHGDTQFLGRGMWSLVGFLGGPAGVLVYWMIHRSTLNPAAAAKQSDPEESAARAPDA